MTSAVTESVNGFEELKTAGVEVIMTRETPHFRDYLAKINDLADRVAVVVHPAQVA